MKLTLLETIATSLCRSYQAAGFGELTLAEARESLSFCDIAFADFASNIGMQKAKILEQSPREIAEKLAFTLQRDPLFAAVTVAGPGFLNLKLATAAWSSFAGTITPGLFKTQVGQGQTVNVEFISANPTGPLVLVNAWGGFYGDILARVYQSLGYTVTREYYLNDGGNQIAQLGRAIQQAAGQTFSEEITEVLYRGEYIDTLVAPMQSEFGGQAELLAADPQAIGELAQAKIFHNLILPTLQRLEIKHDVVTPETQLDNQATLGRLRDKAAVKEVDGAIWLDGERAGIEKDEVLVRSTDGQETYFLKDISYQYDKLVTRGFDTAITIVGPDHHGQEQRLLAAMKLLGVKGFIPLWTQTVRLLRDGVEFKMSKRRGNYIALDDLLDMIPSETARFFFGMRDPNTHFDLDLDLVSAQNKHNPLYYVMYAYVRTGAILEKAGGSSETGDLTKDQVLRDIDRALLRQIVYIQTRIEMTAQTQLVHPILYAIVELASIFHEWYEQSPVLKAEPDLKLQRLQIVSLVRVVYAALFDLIGLTPLDKMVADQSSVSE